MGRSIFTAGWKVLPLFPSWNIFHRKSSWLFIPPLSWGIQNLKGVSHTPPNFLRFQSHYLGEAARNRHFFHIQSNTSSIKTEWFIFDQPISCSQHKSSKGLTTNPASPWKTVGSKRLFCAKRVQNFKVYACSMWIFSWDPLWSPAWEHKLQILPVSKGTIFYPERAQVD